MIENRQRIERLGWTILTVAGTLALLAAFLRPSHATVAGLYAITMLALILVSWGQTDPRIRCTLCGRRTNIRDAGSITTGHKTDWYCHKGPEPSCYEKAVWKGSIPPGHHRQNRP